MYLLSGFFVVNAADIDSGDLEDAILDNKTLLLADLEDAYDDAYDAVVALQDDVSVNAEYQALVCLYVYDGLLDEEDLLARVELLKERVVSTSNALLERLSNAEDNYDAGLSSDATYQLSLE